DNIVRTVNKALDIFPSYAENFEVIIVNDGSGDRTKELAEEMAEKHANVRVVSHEKNRGYGGALKSGFTSAKYENVFYSDGDGQFDLKEIEQLLPLVPECDITAGYRIKRNDPIHRIINGKAYNLLVRILFGLNVRDIDCAFKIIKKKVIENVDLKSESQFISAELLIKAKKKGYSIKQVGVHHYPREKGKPTGNSIRAIIGSFSELFSLWRELL
ncbi:MAG: glycosyltransferase family 2 protein, partial [Candidatus Omnitrophota bacterium]